MPPPPPIPSPPPRSPGTLRAPLPPPLPRSRGVTDIPAFLAFHFASQPSPPPCILRKPVQNTSCAALPPPPVLQCYSVTTSLSASSPSQQTPGALAVPLLGAHPSRSLISGSEQWGPAQASWPQQCSLREAPKGPPGCCLWWVVCHRKPRCGLYTTKCTVQCTFHT